MSISFHALAHHHRHVSLTSDEPLPLPQKEKRDWRCDDAELVAADDVECPEDGQYDGYMMGIDEDSDLDMDMDSQMREWEQERTRTNSDSTHSMSSTTSTESYTSTVSAAPSSTSPRQFPFSPSSSSSSSQAQSPLSVSSTSSTGSPSSPEPVFSQHHNMKPTKIPGFTAPAPSTSTSTSTSTSHLQPQQRQPTKSPSGDRALSRRADSRIIALHDKRVALNRKLYRARMAAGAGVGAAAAASALARRARNSLTLALPHPTPNPTPLLTSAANSSAPALDTSDPSQSLYRDTASPVCRVDPSPDSRHPDPIYNVYTYREIARHVSLSSCWLVVRGRVYDITRFIPHHPAGNFSLLKHAGTDATEHFKMHSPEAQRLWETFQIGWLQGYREQPQTPQNNDKCTIM